MAEKFCVAGVPGEAVGAHGKVSLVLQGGLVVHHGHIKMLSKKKSARLCNLH